MNSIYAELRFIAIKYDMTQAELDMVNRIWRHKFYKTDYVRDDVSTALMEHHLSIFTKIHDWYNVTNIGYIAPGVFAHSNDTVGSLICGKCNAKILRVYAQSVKLFKTCQHCGGSMQCYE